MQEVVDGVAALDGAVGIATLLVGDDYAAQVYQRRIDRHAREAGIFSRARAAARGRVAAARARGPATSSTATARVSGILVLRPLPRHLPESDILRALPRLKDVEAQHPENAGPARARHAALHALDRGGDVPHARPLHGRGRARPRRSPTTGSTSSSSAARRNVGKPAAILGLARNATVISAHKHTADAGRLAEHTRMADLLDRRGGRPRPDHRRLRPRGRDRGRHRHQRRRAARRLDEARRRRRHRERAAARRGGLARARRRRPDHRRLAAAQRARRRRGSRAPRRDAADRRAEPDDRPHAHGRRAAPGRGAPVRRARGPGRQGPQRRPRRAGARGARAARRPAARAHRRGRRRADRARRGSRCSASRAAARCARPRSMLEPDGRSTVLNEHGPRRPPAEWTAYEAAVAGALGPHRALLCSGSLPPARRPTATRG